MAWCTCGNNRRHMTLLALSLVTLCGLGLWKLIELVVELLRS